jgi:ribulose-phosphate 3-epimerase
VTVQIGPSILSADFARLGAEIDMVVGAGADLLHLDVMDAHFVPNLTFGPMVVEAVRRLTDLPLDTHLMVTDPDTYLDDYVKAGANRIDFHLEPFGGDEKQERALAMVDRLADSGVESGIAVNPETPVSEVFPYLGRLDAVLIMTVHPGFGGQSLIQECVEKIPPLRAEITRLGLDVEIGVDGGVNTTNAAGIVKAGADMLVAGSAVFKATDPAGVVKELHRAGESTEA